MEDNLQEEGRDVLVDEAENRNTQEIGACGCGECHCHTVDAEVPTKEEYKEKDICVSIKEIMGAIAGNAIRQQEYLDMPRNFIVVLEKAKEIMRADFTSANDGSFIYRMFVNWDEVYGYIKKTLFSIPEFLDWNLSEYEIANNIKLDDPNRSKFSFTDRYSYTKKEHSFVDLDAFARNVFQSIQRERLPLQNKNAIIE